MKITYEQLQKLRACIGQLKLFQTLFGDEVEVTRELIIEHAEKFDWDWAAGHLLSRKKYEDYEAKRQPIYEDYREKIKPIYEDYWEKRKQIDEDYWEKRKPIFEDYQAKRKQIYEDYQAKIKQIDEDCRRQCAPIFADLLLEGRKI